MIGYEALQVSAAWLDLSGRGKIRATGEDRARLLHAMTTNHVQQLKPGDGCYAFFLTAQGRILADVNILCRGDEFLLDTEPETREKVYQHLDKYIIVDDVALADLTADTATIAIEGPDAAHVLERIGAPAPVGDYSNVEWGTSLIVRTTSTGSPGYFIFVPTLEKSSLIEKLESAGAVHADAEAANIVRLEHGRPRYGDDISERYLPQETNQMHALHFNKGCYLGQEIVERVRSRAQIHRRLLPLHIETRLAPAPGTKLQSGGKDAAEITSAAFSPALQKTVALAYVRLDSKPGDTLQLGEISATVLAAQAPPTPEQIHSR